MSVSTVSAPGPSSVPSSPGPGPVAATVGAMGTQQSPRRTRRWPTVVGIASVGLGVVCLLLSAVPVVNVLALAGGIAAVTLGVAVLRRPPRDGSVARELAIAGVVTGALATLVSLLVIVVLGVVVTTGSSIEEDLGIVTVEVPEG